MLNLADYVSIPLACSFLLLCGVNRERKKPGGNYFIRSHFWLFSVFSCAMLIIRDINAAIVGVSLNSDQICKYRRLKFLGARWGWPNVESEPNGEGGNSFVLSVPFDCVQGFVLKWILRDISKRLQESSAMKISRRIYLSRLHVQYAQVWPTKTIYKDIIVRIILTGIQCRPLKKSLKMFSRWDVHWVK